MAEGKCFLCLDAKSAMAIQLQLLCNILAASGSTVASGVTCGLVDPVADPGVTCQLYVNTADGTLWNWDDAFGVWRGLITLT